MGKTYETSFLRHLGCHCGCLYVLLNGQGFMQTRRGRQQIAFKDVFTDIILIQSGLYSLTPNGAPAIVTDSRFSLSENPHCNVLQRARNAFGRYI